MNGYKQSAQYGSMIGAICSMGVAAVWIAEDNATIVDFAKAYALLSPGFLSIGMVVGATLGALSTITINRIEYAEEKVTRLLDQPKYTQPKKLEMADQPKPDHMNFGERMTENSANESTVKFRPDLIAELAEAKDSERQLTQPDVQNFVMEQLTCVPTQFKESADEMLEILKTKQGLDIPAVKWMIAVGGVLVHAADAARGVNIYGSDFDDLTVMAKKSVTTCKFIYDL